MSKADEIDWDTSRALALKAGAAITTDQGDVTLVLAHAAVISEFLFTGDHEDGMNLRNRRRAVRLALDTMENMARRKGDESILRTDDPVKLTTVAGRYFRFLTTSEPWAAEASREPQADPRRTRMLAIITEAGADGISSADLGARLAAEGLAASRQEMLRWLEQDVDAKLVSWGHGQGRPVTVRAVPA